MIYNWFSRGLSFGMMVLVLGCGGDTGSTEATSSNSEPNVPQTVTYYSANGTAINLTQKQYQVVVAHNQKRDIYFHDANLTYSLTLEEAAQRYANILATSGKFEHDPSNHTYGYGENLYAHSKKEPISIDTAMLHWYDDEQPLYDYETGDCQEAYYSSGDRIQCGHYTQVVWQETREVGCANAQYKAGNFKGGYVYVCKYQKAGNVVGEKPYCLSYSNRDIYTDYKPQLKNLPLQGKRFTIELIVEDRTICSRSENFNSSIQFSDDLKQAEIIDFQIFNNGIYPNTLTFDTIKREDNQLILEGINRHIADNDYKNKPIYMRLKFVGETQEYYAVEIDWNGIDEAQPQFSRQMKAKLYK